MTQVFEEPNLTSDSLPESKQSTESIIREWVIYRCSSKLDRTSPRYLFDTIRNIRTIADIGSFKPDSNPSLLEILDTYSNSNDISIYDPAVNNRYTFSVNGVVLMYSPAAEVLGEVIAWKIV